MRAIALLSQREHSPAELRRKLLRIAKEMVRKAEESGQGVEERDEEATAGHVEAEVEVLVAWLQAQGYLSEARFVESRINARSSRYGSLRIKQELAQHGLSIDAETQATLRASEAERARAVWQRKFGSATAMDDPVQRARQLRFLTARGFSPDIARRVLRSKNSED